MNCEVYAEFLEAIGHSVTKTRSAYWFDPFPWTRLAFPYHHSINPDTDELQSLFRGAGLLRYLTHSWGTPSYYVACSNHDYSLASLEHKARNQTRRGLEHWRVEQVDRAWLAERGVHLNEETLQRQGRPASSFSDRKWREYCLAAAQRPGFEAWAALSGKKLGAVALTFRMDDVVHILLQRSSSECLRTYPNNALTFCLTQNALGREGVRMVFFGRKALAAEESLDHFKQCMGYELVPAHERFHPAPAVQRLRRVALGIVRQVARRGKSERWKKTEVLLTHAR